MPSGILGSCTSSLSGGKNYTPWLHRRPQWYKDMLQKPSHKMKAIFANTYSCWTSDSLCLLKKTRYLELRKITILTIVTLEIAYLLKQIHTSQYDMVLGDIVWKNYWCSREKKNCFAAFVGLIKAVIYLLICTWMNSQRGSMIPTFAILWNCKNEVMTHCYLIGQGVQYSLMCQIAQSSKLAVSSSANVNLSSQRDV